MVTPPADLPPVAHAAYQGLNDAQQAEFNSYYARRRRDTFLMLLLAVLFPIQLFLLGKFWQGVIFWLTGGGFLIWYFIEWFLTPGRVREYNANVAADGLRLISSGSSIAPAPTPTTDPPTAAESEEE